MIVVDASVAAMLFLEASADPRAKGARAALARDLSWVVTEHWKTEVVDTIRGLWLGGKLNDERAGRAITRIPHMAVTIAPMDALLPRVWELRHQVTAYDAAYIAAAEAYNCTLVTADARLGRSGAVRCPVTVIG